MKKISMLFIIIFMLLLTGCESTSNYKLITCTKEATLSDSDTTADIKYEVYYEGDYVKKTVSTEKITSNNEQTLKKYKDSYEKVFSKYKNIKYYTNTVTTNANTVTSKTTINYNKVDSTKIIEIEGKEGNIFEEDGKVKLNTLLSVYKKYGSSCDN